jgi:hypothetical protein
MPCSGMTGGRGKRGGGSRGRVHVEERDRLREGTLAWRSAAGTGPWLTGSARAA